MENIFGDKKIQVVRHVGDLNSAYLEEDGTTVHRKDKITIPAYETVPVQEVPCAPYDNHFIFRHAYKKKGVPVRGWTLWCTCGSPAAIVGYDGYSLNASNSGQLVVCLFHAQYGKHSDGSS